MEEGFLHFDPQLIEEAVFTALKNNAEAASFHTERAPLYDIPDVEEREQRFGALHRSWFQRLKLADVIVQALREQSTLISRAGSCIVLRSLSKQQEGAELLVSANASAASRAGRTIRFLLCPESLLDGPALLTFLRHELLHVVDMLDPKFGYAPELPRMEGGPVHDSLLQERYRTLWDSSIDGRMVQQGWLAESMRAQHLSSFARGFPMLGAETEDFFSRFFDGEIHTHAGFVSFARNPGTIGSHDAQVHQPGSRCALCGFPTHAFEPLPSAFPQEVMTEIWSDFPSWRPADGICVQCADLYRARRISRTAVMAMPGGAANAIASRKIMRD